MNLRKTLFSAFTAVALCASVMTPVAMADTNPDTNANTEVTDGGIFEFWLWKQTLDFGSQSVTAAIGSEPVTSAMTLEVNDTRTGSPGYSIVMSATDFSNDDNSHFIAKSNLTITNVSRGGAIHSCDGDFPDPPADNPSQVVSPHGNADVSLASDVVIFSATAGNGCGDYRPGISFSLTVPAGTVADDYTSVLTVTDSVGAGS